MRTSLGATLGLAVALLGFSSSTARAEEVCRITVPFPFVVNGHTLPSGRYDVRTADGNPAIVTIDGLGNTRAHAMVSTIAESGRAPSDGKPALTFVRKGDQYRLSTVWESSDYGHEIVIR